MLSNPVMIVITILVINIVYVSFSTIRMILTLKGRRYLAAFVSIFEMIVYVVGLSIVLDNLDHIQNILAYAIGFALGIISGSAIEERLALGYISINVVSANPDLPFGEELRKEGFGVTSWLSSGRDGHRLSMQILAPRKQEMKLYKLVKEIDPRAFIISYEPKHIQGGFWVKQIRRSQQRKKEQIPPPEIQYELENEMPEKEVENELKEEKQNGNKENTTIHSDK